MPDIIFDIIILAVLLLTAVQGYRRGFILTLCGFLAVFVAFLGGAFLSDQLCQPVGQLIQPAIENSILQVLDLQPADASATADGAPPPNLPGVPQEDTPPLQDLIPLEQVLNALRESEYFRGFADSIQQAMEDGIVQATGSAVRAISVYLAREVARLILFLVCFILVLAAWTLLSHTLDLAFRLPVLSTLNAWSGLAVGLIKGGLLVFIATWFLKGGLLSQETIQNTILLKFFCENSPLSLLSQFLPQ